MKNNYFAYRTLIVASFLVLIVASCKKDNKSAPTVTNATPLKFAVYEQLDSLIYRQIFIPIPTIGTVTLSEDFNALLFDTGSGGMVIDASGIIPSNLITNKGFNFTGDSTVYDGITITNQTDSIQYGDDANLYTVYGNLAYANVTIGTQGEGGIINIKRLPFLLYYKATDNKGNLSPAHDFDVFGADPEYDLTFPNNVILQSPFNLYNPGTGLTKGFKIGPLGTSNFSDAYSLPLTDNVITLGLTASDLSSASGFTMTNLQYDSRYGADPVIAGKINYNNKTISANIVYDSGTSGYSYIEDNTAAKITTTLPQGSAVSATLNSGFNYAYTIVPNEYLTYVENPGVSNLDVSIFSIDYFINNEYMLDYTDNKLGLKNN
ncbi:pepsin/retropepsin-like aspartic protease family protein [Mucilaginibacter sp.]